MWNCGGLVIVSELLMSKDTVITTLNLFPDIDYLLDFDQRIAVKAFLHGDPTDEQQVIVLGICKAIMDSNLLWSKKHGKSVS